MKLEEDTSEVNSQMRPGAHLGGDEQIARLWRGENTCGGNDECLAEKRRHTGG